MRDTTKTSGGGVTRQDVVKYFPHLNTLAEDTSFVVFREFKPRNLTTEFTVYYQEPGKAKMRVDAELSEYDEMDARNLRITYWGKAEGAIR